MVVTHCQTSRGSFLHRVTLILRYSTYQLMTAARQLGFLLGLVLVSSVRGQAPFTTNSLPAQAGEYNCSYYSSNVDVAPLLALSTNASLPPLLGGAPLQQWNFGAAEQPDESVLRTDIIAPANGGNSGSFPSAIYAEQDTMEPSTIVGWRYYGFTGAGRVYYGLDEPVPDATPQAVFVPPAIDIPASVQFGQTWNRTLYWNTLYYESILVSNYCSASAIVDAYGTMDLPQIGAVPAYRVHETHSYIISEIADPPVPLDMHTDQYYYWLVPNLGVAVEILLLGNNVLYPVDMPYTNTFQRMYFANYFTNSGPTPPIPPSIPSFPTNLSIQKIGESVVLNWQNFTNATSYRIDYVGGSGTWEPLGYTAGNAWTDSISSVQRYYRVVGSP